MTLSATLAYTHAASAFKMRHEAKGAMATWLAHRWQWTHAVTLTFNDPMLSASKAREILREWDARTNRNLLGPKWRKKEDERLFAAWFLEKPGVNPHWHGLMMIDQHDPAIIETWADANWQKLVPSGDILFDADKTKIKQTASYITKQLTHATAYENFILPNEFTNK